MAESKEQKSVVLEIGDYLQVYSNEVSTQTGTTTVSTFDNCENDGIICNWNTDFNTFNGWKDMEVTDIEFLGDQFWIPGLPSGAANTANVGGVNFFFNGIPAQSVGDGVLIKFDFNVSSSNYFNGGAWSWGNGYGNILGIENRVSEGREVTEQGRMLYAYPKAGSGLTKAMSFEIMEGDDTELVVKSCGAENLGDFLQPHFPSETSASIMTAAFFQKFTYTISPYVHTGQWRYENNAINLDSTRESVHVSYVNTPTPTYASLVGNLNAFGVRSSGEMFDYSSIDTFGYHLRITIDSMVNCSVKVLMYASSDNYPPTPQNPSLTDIQFALDALNIDYSQQGQWVWQEITQPGTYDICVPYVLDAAKHIEDYTSIGAGGSTRVTLQTGGGSFDSKKYYECQYHFLNIVPLNNDYSITIRDFELKGASYGFGDVYLPVYSTTVVESEQWDFKALDILDSTKLPISLSYTSGDLTDPGKKTTGFSKTFELPASPRNNRILKNLIAPTTKKEKEDIGWKKARIKVNGINVFHGYARIERANTKTGGTYKCHILQDPSFWPELIGNAKLCELSFPGEVVKNYQNVVDSWSVNDSDDKTFVYPAINYGKWSPGNGTSAACANQPKTIDDFHPAIFVKPLVEKIFSTVGYTVHSDFFETDMFKKLIIPYTSGEDYAPQGDPFGQDGDYSGYATKAAEYYLPKLPATGLNNIYTTRTHFPIHIVQDGTSFMSANYTTSSINNGYVAPFTGYYNLYYDCELYMSQGGNESGRWSVYFHKNGTPFRNGMFAPIVAWSSFTYQIQNNMSYCQATGESNAVWFEDDLDGSFAPDGMELEGVYLQQGDKIQVGFYGRNESNAYGCWTRIKNQNFYVYPTPGQTFNPGGAVVNLSSALGCSVKQKDVLKGLTQMFNLYWTSDNEAKKVFVEPYDDFYGSGKVVDWTDKLDYSGWEDKYLIDELAKSVRFSYKHDDGDGILTRYKDSMTSTNGYITERWAYTVTNEDLYRKDEEELGSTVFSPTMPLYSGGSGSDETFCISQTDNPPVMPVMWSGDDVNWGWFTDSITRPNRDYSFNIRILNWYGLSNNVGTWQMLDDNGVIQTKNSYPYAHTYNYNHANTSTYPDNLAWHNIGSGSTFQRGLYDRFWIRYYRKISGGAMLRTCRMNFNPQDLSTLDFRDIVKLEMPGGVSTYWTVNKIVDYKPGADELTKVELVEWKYEIPGSPVTNSIYDSYSAPSGGAGVGTIDTPTGTVSVSSNGDKIPLKDKGEGLLKDPILNISTDLTLATLSNKVYTNKDKKINMIEVSDKGGLTLSQKTTQKSNKIKGTGIALGKSLEADDEQVVLGKYNSKSSSDVFQVGGGYYDKKKKQIVRQNVISVSKSGEFCVYGGEVVAEFQTGDLTITGDVYYTDSKGNKKKVYLKDKDSSNY